MPLTLYPAPDPYNLMQANTVLGKPPSEAPFVQGPQGLMMENVTHHMIDPASGTIVVPNSFPVRDFGTAMTGVDLHGDQRQLIRLKDDRTVLWDPRIYPNMTEFLRGIADGSIKVDDRGVPLPTQTSHSHVNGGTPKTKSDSAASQKGGSAGGPVKVTIEFENGGKLPVNYNYVTVRQDRDLIVLVGKAGESFQFPFDRDSPATKFTLILPGDQRVECVFVGQQFEVAGIMDIAVLVVC
jgi:hypothetical protein